MSGLSSNTGLISGINSGAIIDQLLAVEGRPKILIQRHVAQLQTQQASFLELNSKFSALRTAAQKLRLNKLFDASRVSSSNADALSGTASAGTPAGNYSFLVDRLVSTHQLLSRGVTDRNVSGVGLTSLTLESNQSRLDSDTQLGSLNGGAGVARGKVNVTNRAGVTTTIDLSRTGTVSEVLDAFNSNTAARVSASISGGRLVLTDNSGGAGSLSVANATGYTTAASLGIEQSVAGGTLTGSLISYLGDNTTIGSLNDGNGIRVTSAGGTASYDFDITAKDGSLFHIDIGSVYGADGVATATPVTTIAQLKARISSQTSGKVTVATKADGTGIQLVDSSGGGGQLTVHDLSGSAADLGFVGTLGATATFAGTTADSKALLAALGSRLSSTLRGGQGLTATDLAITVHNGSVFNFAVNASGSVSDLLQSVSDGTGGRVTGALGNDGTSLVFTDHTVGVAKLVVGGGAAALLGVDTGAGGTDAASVSGTRIDRAYVALSTTLASLNGGRGVGTGTFRILGADGATKDVTIGTSVVTVSDLLDQINSGTNIGVRARINDAGNGVIVEKDPAFVGADQRISITDTNGAVGRALNLAGTAAVAGPTNFIDGSYRVSVGVSTTDTLDQVIAKINSAHAGVTASVVTDGSSAAPFRLKFTSNFAGDNGQFQVTSAGTDLGLSLVARGSDSRVFYGSDDPARAILVKRNSNTIDGVVEGLHVDLHTTGATPVSLTVSRDTDATLAAIQEFVTAFNALSSKIGDLTSYDAATQKRGTLLGDSTTLSLRNELNNTLQGTPLGTGGRYNRLAQVGLKISRDNSISIDAEKLRTAIQTDPEAVKDLFSAFEQQPIPQFSNPIPGVTGIQVLNTTTQGAYSKLGVFERIARLADKYVNSADGVLTNRGKNLDTSIAADNDRISAYDKRLAAKRLFLEAQFAGLESTLAKLQAQQSSLSSLRTV